MSKKQIEKDFKELYQEKNQEKLIRAYYKEKKKELLIIFFAGLFLYVLLFYTEYRDALLEDGNIIQRIESGGSSTKIRLKVKGEDKSWETIEVDLGKREWKEEELEEAFLRLTEELPEHILGENISLDEIRRDLIFSTEIKGYPFYLQWESSVTDLIDNAGRLQQEIRKEDVPVEICMRAVCNNWQKEYSFYITVLKTDESSWLTSLREYVLRQEENSREDKTFHLPIIFKGEYLQWKYQINNISPFLLPLTFIVMTIIWQEKDREIKKRTERRRQSLKREYPGFISRLVLYLGCGVSIKESIFKMNEEYGRNKTESCLSREIANLSVQMKNGLPEQKAYEMLAFRCPTSEYKKLSALLQQQKEKGSYGLLKQLKKEMDNANEEYFKRLKKEGEKMGTKLLLPMMLLLGMVMALIMIPAFYSFQL